MVLEPAGNEMVASSRAGLDGRNRMGRERPVNISTLSVGFQMTKHSRSTPRLPGGIGGLSSHVWRGFDGQPAGETHATGFEALDAQLPGGGWPAAALTEIILEHHGIGELSLLMPAIARLCVSDVGEQIGGWVFWIAPPFIPYAPALSRHGIDLSRMLLVHAPATRSAGLWAVEQALRARSCAAMLAWVRTADQTVLRRLQLAAEQARCWTVLFRPAAALRQRSPAALRLRLTRVDSMTRVEILKCRGARPGVVHIRHDDVEC
jgi:hypothetical protein